MVTNSEEFLKKSWGRRWRIRRILRALSVPLTPSGVYRRFCLINASEQDARRLSV